MSESVEHAAEHTMTPEAAHASSTKGTQFGLALMALGRAVLLLACSAYFFALYGSGSVRNYVNPEFNWLVLVSAGLFLLLGLVAAGQGLRPRSAAHSHAAPRWGLLLALTVPLLLGTFVPVRPLGAAGASFRSMPDGPRVPDPPAWTIADWTRAFHYKAFPESYYTGQPVDLIGFVLRPGGLAADHFAVGRYVMQHCIADVYGVALLIASPGSDMIPDGTWVRVQGTLSVETVQGEHVLQVTATRVDASIGAPDYFYLYPQNFAKW